MLNFELNKENLSLLLEVAIHTAIKKYEENMEKESKYNTRIFMTRCLLKNYRALKVYKEQAIFSKIQAKDNFDYFVDYEEVADDSIFIKTIMENRNQTAIIIDHIDKMLAIYEKMCRQTGGEEQLFYNIIYDMYINENPNNADFIASKYNISKPTLFRYLKKANTTLSCLFFGIDNISSIENSI